MVYDYQCKRCSLEFEVEQKLSDPTPACPDCTGVEVKRLISKPPLFQLIGRGWAADRYSK